MVDSLFGVNTQVSERIVQYLFLYFVLRNYVTIELRLQLKPHGFDVDDVVADQSFTFLRKNAVSITILIRAQ